MTDPGMGPGPEDIKVDSETSLDQQKTELDILLADPSKPLPNPLELKIAEKYLGNAERDQEELTKKYFELLEYINNQHKKSPSLSADDRARIDDVEKFLNAAYKVLATEKYPKGGEGSVGRAIDEFRQEPKQESIQAAEEKNEAPEKVESRAWPLEEIPVEICEGSLTLRKIVDGKPEGRILTGKISRPIKVGEPAILMEGDDKTTTSFVKGLRLTDEGNFLIITEDSVYSFDPSLSVVEGVGKPVPIAAEKPEEQRPDEEAKPLSPEEIEALLENLRSQKAETPAEGDTSAELAAPSGEIMPDKAAIRDKLMVLAQGGEDSIKTLEDGMVLLDCLGLPKEFSDEDLRNRLELVQQIIQENAELATFSTKINNAIKIGLVDLENLGKSVKGESREHQETNDAEEHEAAKTGIRNSVEAYLNFAFSEQQDIEEELSNNPDQLLTFLGLNKDFTKEELNQRYDLFIQVVNEYREKRHHFRQLRDQLAPAVYEGYVNLLNKLEKKPSVFRRTAERLSEKLQQRQERKSAAEVPGGDEPPEGPEKPEKKGRYDHISNRLERDIEELNNPEKRGWTERALNYLSTKSELRLAAGTGMAVLSAVTGMNTAILAARGLLGMAGGSIGFSGWRAGKREAKAYEKLNVKMEGCFDNEGKLDLEKIKDKINSTDEQSKLSREDLVNLYAEITEIASAKGKKIAEKLEDMEGQTQTKMDKLFSGLSEKLEKNSGYIGKGYNWYMRQKWYTKAIIGIGASFGVGYVGAFASGAAVGTAGFNTLRVLCSGAFQFGLGAVQKSPDTSSKYYAGSDKIIALRNAIKENYGDLTEDELKEIQRYRNNAKANRMANAGIGAAAGGALVGLSYAIFGHHNAEAHQGQTAGAHHGAEAGHHEDTGVKPNVRPEVEPKGGTTSPQPTDGNGRVDANGGAASLDDQKRMFENGYGRFGREALEPPKATVTEVTPEPASDKDWATALREGNQQPDMVDASGRVHIPGIGEESATGATGVLSPHEPAPMTAAEHEHVTAGSHNTLDEQRMAGGSLEGHEGGKFMGEIYEGLKGKGQLPEGAENEPHAVQAMIDEAKKMGIIDAHNHLTAKIDAPEFDPMKFTEAVLHHDDPANIAYLHDLSGDLTAYEKAHAAAEHAAAAGGVRESAENRGGGLTHREMTPEESRQAAEAGRDHLEKATGEKLPVAWKPTNEFEAYNNGKAITDPSVLERLKDGTIPKNQLDYMLRLENAKLIRPEDIHLSPDGKHLLVVINENGQDNVVWQVNINKLSWWKELTGQKPNISELVREKKTILEATIEHPKEGAVPANAEQNTPPQQTPPENPTPNPEPQILHPKEAPEGTPEPEPHPAAAPEINSPIADNSHLAAELNANPTIHEYGISNIHGLIFDKNGKLEDASFIFPVKETPRDFGEVTANMTGEQRWQALHNYYLNVIREQVEARKD